MCTLKHVMSGLKDNSFRHTTCIVREVVIGSSRQLIGEEIVHQPSKEGMPRDRKQNKKGIGILHKSRT